MGSEMIFSIKPLTNELISDYLDFLITVHLQTEILMDRVIAHLLIKMKIL
jgi:hypothetical protein